MQNTSVFYKMFQIFNFIFLGFVCLITLYPFLYIFAVSFSDMESVLKGTVTFYPKGFTLNAYKIVLSYPGFGMGVYNTFIYTIGGTIVSLFITVLCAYPLSKSKLKGNKIFMSLIVFTMFFNGGIIPNFLLIKQLGLINTRFAIILPAAINTWNMIIMRTFFVSIPESLEEAAAIDGLNPFQILYKIILPLSKPILATIGLFYAVWFYNDWFRPMLYLNDHNLYPATLFLRNIVMGAELNSGTDDNAAGVIAENMRSATIILVTLPILIVYPFVQKYFVKGIMIGSVKG